MCVIGPTWSTGVAVHTHTHTHTHIYLHIKYIYTYMDIICIHAATPVLIGSMTQDDQKTSHQVMWRLLSLWLCCLPPSSFRNSGAIAQKPGYSKRTYKEPKHLDDLSNVTELPTQGELPDGHTHMKQINVIISHCSGWAVIKYLTQQTAARVRCCLRKSRAPGTAPWWGWENREVPEKAGKEKLLLERKM